MCLMLFRCISVFMIGEPNCIFIPNFSLKSKTAPNLLPQNKTALLLMGSCLDPRSISEVQIYKLFVYMQILLVTYSYFIMQCIKHNNHDPGLKLTSQLPWSTTIRIQGECFCAFRIKMPEK